MDDHFRPHNSHNRKASFVHDIISENNLSFLSATELWHTTSLDIPLLRAVPQGFRVIDQPRPVDPSSTRALRTNHGGVAIFYSDRFSGKRLNLGFSPTTFELLACSLRSSSIIYTQVVIYLPGSEQVTDRFFDEITTLLEIVATFQSQVVISGDFNIHVDDPNDRHGHHFLEILDSFDMVQNITGSTHKGGHTLDFVITRRNSPPTGYRVDPPVYSDHSLVLCAFPPMNFAVHHKTKNVRFWKHLDRDSFRKSLLDSQLCGGTDTLSTMSPSALFDLYDGTLRRIVDEHLPVKEVSVRDRPLTPWFDNDCRAAKRKVRMLERRYRRTHSAMDCMAWVRQLERKRDLLERKEERYWNEKIASNAGKPKKLWSLLNSLQQKDRANQPPASDGISAESLSNFFRDKVEKVRDETSSADPPTFTKLTDASFVSFRECSMEEVRRFLIQSPPKSCSLDPLPTFILQEFMNELLPFIHIMCNISMQHGVLPESQKSAIVTPILKKYDLDPDDVRNYRPISNLTFLSKVIERIVASQLTGYLQENKLFPDLQSAYRQGHSTETALLKIFSDILDAADSAQVTLLGLLDLSAAFDTVDHDILLTRLQVSSPDLR